MTLIRPVASLSLEQTILIPSILVHTEQTAPVLRESKYKLNPLSCGPFGRSFLRFTGSCYRRQELYDQKALAQWY